MRLQIKSKSPAAELVKIGIDIAILHPVRLYLQSGESISFYYGKAAIFKLISWSTNTEEILISSLLPTPEWSEPAGWAQCNLAEGRAVPAARSCVHWGPVGGCVTEEAAWRAWTPHKGESSQHKRRC